MKKDIKKRICHEAIVNIVPIGHNCIEHEIKYLKPDCVRTEKAELSTHRSVVAAAKVLHKTRISPTERYIVIVRAACCLQRLL